MPCQREQCCKEKQQCLKAKVLCLCNPVVTTSPCCGWQLTMMLIHLRFYTVLGGGGGGGGGGEGLPNISYIGTVRPSGYHFQGPPS